MTPSSTDRPETQVCLGDTSFLVSLTPSRSDPEPSNQGASRERACLPFRMMEHQGRQLCDPLHAVPGPHDAGSVRMGEAEPRPPGDAEGGMPRSVFFVTKSALSVLTARAGVRLVVLVLAMPASVAIAAPALAGSATAAASPAPSVTSPAPTWTLQSSPNARGSTLDVLEGISCVSGGTCAAVGYSNTSTGGAQGLALGNSGSTWNIETMPAVPDARDVEMTGISCTSSSWCDAVGFTVGSGPGLDDLNMAEHWDGDIWSIVPTPEPGPADAKWSGLSGISCASSNYCLAVGGYIENLDNPDAEEQPFALQWNGSTWSMLDAPNPQAENGSAFSAVSCVAPDRCEVTGDYDYADVAQSVFAFSYDGTTWVRQSQRNPEGQEFNSDNAVSCTALDSCTSVGYWTSTGPQPLVERYRGEWTTQQVPLPSGLGNNGTDEVVSVSCVIERGCAAVGQWSDNLNDYPSSAMALTWNGTAWQLDTTANPNGNSALNAVSCVAGSGCVGVGGTSASIDDVETLIEVSS